MPNETRSGSSSSHSAMAPVRCHRCPAAINENTGYWVALSPWHVTADGLPIVGHLYCGACIDNLYHEALRISRANFVTRFLKRRRAPGRFDTAVEVSREIAEAGLSKEQWKSRCHDAVSWWWERRRLVSKGMVPPWADRTEVDNVVGKYRIQREPWALCGRLCDLADETRLAEIVAQYDDLIQHFPGFAAYALYCRGVWLQSLIHGESGTRGLSTERSNYAASCG